MKKKLFLRLVIFLPLLFFTSLSYPQDSRDSNPPFQLNREGIYELRYATIKFIPPKGWNYITSDNLYHIEFRKAENRIEDGTLTITIYSAPLGFDVDDIMKDIKEKMNDIIDESRNILISQDRESKFLDTYARDLIFKFQIKHRLIVFKKFNRAFKITFSADEQIFDNLLKEIDESLLGLEILEAGN